MKPKPKAEASDAEAPANGTNIRDRVCNAVRNFLQSFKKNERQMAREIAIELLS
jgi:hypothetical protein